MESPYRREVLADIRSRECSHAGLWLDKYMGSVELKDGEEAKTALVRETADLRMNELYGEFYKRWKQDLEAAGAKLDEGEVQGRLAVNLGSESVLETSIALHHTYGVPYIPGSALKGVSAFYARNYLDPEQWGEEKDNYYRVLFGDQENAGYVTFHDALYVPGSAAGDKMLSEDIITVHHPDYYQGRDVPPADWDSPTPIPFLSATGSYLFALSGPEGWVTAAFKVLDQALETIGVGAKTSSGYGRIKLEGSYKPKPKLIEGVGTVEYFGTRSKRGKLKDDQTEDLIRFNGDALVDKSYTPGKKHKVKYTRYEGADSAETVERKRY